VKLLRKWADLFESVGAMQRGKIEKALYESRAGAFKDAAALIEQHVWISEQPRPIVKG